MSAYVASPCPVLINSAGIVVGIIGIDGREWLFPATPTAGADGPVTAAFTEILFDATNKPVGVLANGVEYVFSAAFTVNLSSGFTVGRRSSLLSASGQPLGVSNAGASLYPTPPVANGGAAPTALAIVPLGGQSNESGRGIVDAVLDAPTANTFEYGGYSADGAKYQLITQAADPLDHPDQGAGLGQALGPGTAMARQLFANTGFRVLLVPAAFGGTGLVPGANATWSPYGSSNAQLLFFISQVNAAIAAAQAQFPGSFLEVIDWAQGEADAAAAIAGPLFQQSLYDMFLFMRASITGAAHVPIVIHQMLPEAIALNSGPSGAGTGTYAAIDAAHTAVAAGMPFVTKIAIGSGYNTSGDNLHYGAVGCRLMGATAANAIPTALANAGDPTPAQVTGLAVGTVTATSVALAWTAVAGSRNYTVQSSSDGGTTWQTMTGSIPNVSTLTNSATVIGLSSSTSYQFRVRANAYGATPNGAFSATVTQATSAGLADAFVQLTSITGAHITQSGSAGVGWTYTSTTGGTYTTDHAGTSNLKMPAGVLGSLRGAASTTLTGEWILALVTSQTDPAYNAGASGYKFGIISSNTGNYKVIVDGGGATVTGNGTVVAAQVGDILQLVRADASGTILAQVARAASPTVFTTVHTFAAKSTADLWGACAPNATATTAMGPLIGNGWA
jgi:hypothetical protein